MSIQLFLLLLILFPSAHGQSICSPSGYNDQIQRLDQTAKKIITDVNVTAARENMGEFCKRNLFLRFLNAQNKAPIGCESWPLQKLEKYVDDVVSPDSDLDLLSPWQLALISTEKSRNKSNSMLKGEIDSLVKSFWKNQPVGSYVTLESMLQEKAPSEVPAATTQMLNNVEQRKPSAEVAKLTSNKNKLAACLLENPLSFLNCKKGIDFAETKNQMLASPSGLAIQFTVFGLWKKFFSTSKYNEGLRLAAIKMQERARGQLNNHSNAFDDIKESFAKSGLSEQDAVEATWDTLGLISNGGQNTTSRAIMLEPSQKSASLAVIASSLSQLDLLKGRKGLPLYSYPPNIQTKCDNAKPYHFWMSAYLARGMVREKKIDAKTAADTAFTISKGYQLVGRDLLKGKSNNNAILTRQPFDPAHQIVRTDLAFSMAGAEFGAYSADQKMTQNIDVDGAIVDLIQNAAVKSPLSKEDAASLSLPSLYFMWNKIFSPDSAKKAIRRNVE